jgi:hypothetical protein
MRRRVILGKKQSSGGKCCLHPQGEDEYWILVYGAYYFGRRDPKFWRKLVPVS